MTSCREVTWFGRATLCCEHGCCDLMQPTKFGFSHIFSQSWPDPEPVSQISNSNHDRASNADGDAFGSVGEAREQSRSRS